MRALRYLLLLLFIPCALSAQTRFVATTGSDTANNCTFAGTPCATINHAIGQANPGETIVVRAGTYAEGGTPIAVNKSVMIAGAQSGPFACTRSGLAESIVTVPFVVTVPASIHGFTITCGTCGTVGAAVHTSQTTSGYGIVNNIITGNTMGIYLSSSPVGGQTSGILFNRFTNNNIAGSSAGNGIYGDTTGTDFLISENCFSEHDNSDILLIGRQAPYLKVDVTNNTFTEDGDTSSVVLFDNVDNSKITDNTITGGAGPGICPATGVDNLLISGNTITGGTDRAAISVFCADFGNGFGNNGLITIERNVLRNNARGVRTFGGTALPLQVHCNVIEDNSVADIVTLDAGIVVDAERNWFGCNDPPNGCGVFSVFAGSTIDFDPWRVMDVSAILPTIALSGEATIRADFNQNSDGAPLSACFPDGQIVSFSATGGTVNPTTDDTAGGVATTRFTPTGGGVATASATFDDETVTANIVVVAADLQVTGSVGPTIENTPATKTMTVTNNGPSTATSVTLTDALPGAFIGATASQGSCVNAVNTVTCNLGTLNAAASATVTIQFVTPPGGAGTNTVTVGAAEFDPNLANNTAIIPFASLSQAAVPTLSPWMLALLGMMMAAAAVVIMRR